MVDKDPAVVALETRVSRLEDDMKEVRRKSSESREAIFHRLNELDKANARTDEKYKNIMEELEEQKGQLLKVLTKLDALSQKPAKRWDDAMKTVITAIIGAVMGIVTGKLFGGG